MNLSDETLIEAVQAVKLNGSINKAAKVLGVARSTMQARMQRATERGLDGTVAAPAAFGRKVVGVSTLYREDGSKAAQWVKERNEPTVEDIVGFLKESFEGFEAPYLNPSPTNFANDDLLTLIPIADAHMGLFSWKEETGNDWDSKIANRIITNTAQRLIAGSPDAGHCIILGGGDALHTNTFDNQTAKSKNVLDVDSRFSKILRATCELFVKIIDLALQKFPKVTVRNLAGNHDTEASFAISYFLMAWYRNEPRVEVDASPSLFWWYRFGNVLLGAVHGHTTKMKDMPQIMAVRRAEDWGQTQHRYVHTFHIHHISKFVNEEGGVICESHQSPAAQDAWHHNSGYLSGRSMQSITYHAKHGEVTRNRVAIYDE